MNLEVEMRPEESYLYAQVSGKRSVDNISSVARQVIGACVQYRLDSALIDVRDFEGRISIFDAFMIPARVFPSLRKLGVLNRVAILDTRERRERLAFFEGISRKGGYNLRAFTELERAVSWLTSEVEAESKA